MFIFFFYWSSIRKNFILMSLFLIFSNKIFMKKIIVVLQLQFLLISISCSFLIKKHFAARHGLGNGYLLGSILLSFYRLDYWGIQAGLLTPLTFARYRLSPLAAFTSGAYFLQNGRQLQWICEVYSANFKGIFLSPIVIMCLAVSNNWLLVL